MATTKTKLPPMVQMYDYSKVKEYYKRYQGLFFSHEEIVRTDRIENYLEMRIDVDKMPDKIIFNGKEMKLVDSN